MDNLSQTEWVVFIALIVGILLMLGGILIVIIQEVLNADFKDHKCSEKFFWCGFNVDGAPTYKCSKCGSEYLQSEWDSK